MIVFGGKDTSTAHRDRDGHGLVRVLSTIQARFELQYRGAFEIDIKVIVLVIAIVISIVVVVVVVVVVVSIGRGSKTLVLID